MTLDDIFTWCDDTILMVVEFATMNTQNAVGQGVCSLYCEDETGHPLLDAAASNTVILPTAYKSTCVPGAVLDIGTSKSGGNVASRVVTSVQDYSDTAYCVVTFSGNPVDILTTHYCAIHGMSNTADAEIGSKSGYIGTDGAAAEGYLNALHILTRHPLAPFGKATGGNSSNPIGDYLWVPGLTAGNTILVAGASAGNGASVGRFYGSWWYSAGASGWGSAVLLFLISPEGD